MKPLHPFSALRGVTLTEVMIVIAIIGILAGVALPSYRDAVLNSQMKQAAESLADDLKYARTEAIKRSCNVTFSSGANKYLIATVSGTGGCSTSDTLKTVDTSQFVPTFSVNAVTFSFLRGTIADDVDSTVTASGKTLTIRTKTSGKVFVCGGLFGYPTCSSEH